MVESFVGTQVEQDLIKSRKGPNEPLNWDDIKAMRFTAMVSFLPNSTPWPAHYDRLARTSSNLDAGVSRGPKNLKHYRPPGHA